MLPRPPLSKYYMKGNISVSRLAPIFLSAIIVCLLYNRRTSLAQNLAALLFVFNFIYALTYYPWLIKDLKHSTTLRDKYYALLIPVILLVVCNTVVFLFKGTKLLFLCLAINAFMLVFHLLISKIESSNGQL